MGTVALRDIRKSFGSVDVLHGIDLDVEDGEFVVLVGPSGCGKSTLLRTLAGLETATSGEIQIDSHRVNDLAPKERDIAMVFQNYALYPNMTVAQNMGFSLRLAKASKDEIVRKVTSAADILGLRELLERYPRQLSGGQRQRVAMGRAIVRNPKVFLFDEPLSNLDAKLRVQMRSEIKQLHNRLSTTTVYVTHDQIEAMTMADKIVVMRSGRIEQIGSPLELYDHPANSFVAGFIGSPSMNFLSARLEGGVASLPDGTKLPVGREHAAVNRAMDVTLGVRPEDLRVGEAGFACKVIVVEPTGSETQLTTEANGVTIVVTSRKRLSLQPGETVRLNASPDKIHLFDPGTGESLGMAPQAAGAALMS